MKTGFTTFSRTALICLTARAMSAMTVVVSPGPHYSPDPVTLIVTNVHIPGEYVETYTDYFGTTRQRGREGVFSYTVTPRMGPWMTMESFDGGSDTLTYDIPLMPGDYQFYVTANAREFDDDHYFEEGYYDDGGNWQSTGWSYCSGSSWDGGQADDASATVTLLFGPNTPVAPTITNSVLINPNGVVPPTLTTTAPPQLSIHAGQSATLMVTATGVPNPTIAWYKTDPWNNRTQLGTGPTFTLANVSWADNGMKISAIATNSVGTAPNWPATIVVLPPLAAPVITAQPVGLNTTAGTYYYQTLNVTATGEPTPTYQWRKNGVDIPGANGSTLIFWPIQLSDAGAYTVVVSNTEGSVTSVVANVAVRVWTLAPYITKQPVSQTVDLGQRAGFAVDVSGMPPFSFQWRKNGANLDGQNGSSLTIPVQSASDAGVYSVVVSNADGSAISDNATLAINGVPPPVVPLSITQQPQSQTVAAGSTVTLTSGAYSTITPIVFQWQKLGQYSTDYASIPGATGATLTLTNVQQGDFGYYRFAAYNAQSLVFSSPALLTLIDSGSTNTAPFITRQPVNQIAAPEGSAVFTVDAIGTQPLGYQWHHNGTPIASQTNSTLALLNVGAADTGSYDVVVANNYGSTTSTVATFTIDPNAQTIRFFPLPNRAVDPAAFNTAQASFPIYAATTSGLLPSLSILSGPATISGNLITLTGAGEVVVHASQAGGTVGGTSYDPTAVDRSFTVVANASGATGQSETGRSPVVRAVTGPALFDLDGDGLEDEIIPVGTGGFNMDVWELDFTSIVADIALDVSLYAIAPGLSGPFTASDARTAGVPAFNPSAIDPLLQFVALPQYVDVSYRFTPAADRYYQIFGEFNHRYRDNVANWPATWFLDPSRYHGSEEAPVDGGEVTVDDGPLDIGSVVGQPYYLIKFGGTRNLQEFPAGSPSSVEFRVPVSSSSSMPVHVGLGAAAGRIFLPIGNVGIGLFGDNGIVAFSPSPAYPMGPALGFTTGGCFMRGLPGVGALTPGTTITLGSLGSVQVDLSGNVTVNIAGGTTIQINRAGAGGGSITFPGGSAIFVDGKGKITGLTLPSNFPRILVDAVRVATKIAQHQPVWVVRDVLGTISPVAAAAISNGGIDIAVATENGRLQLGVRIGDGQPVWLTADRGEPSLHTRDRFLLGSVDTSLDLFRGRSLEFVNTTTGENLGTFHLNGSGGTHVYESKDDILSDGELDRVLAGTLTDSSAALTQRVVMWKRELGSSAILFSMVFGAVGDVEIRVKDDSGAVVRTFPCRLTPEPNFGGLLDHLAQRIQSIEMPSVSNWSLLDPVNGPPDPDDDVIIAAAPTPAYRIAAMRLPENQTQTGAAHSVAWAAWSNNFLAKAATAADEAVSHADANPSLVFKIGGGFIKGFVDGAWDGLKGDAEGIAELGKMVGNGFLGDFHRVKAMWDGIRGILNEVITGNGSQIFDQMLTKFVDSAQVSVPWNNVGSTSDQWGVGAYVVGYSGGFITEQIVFISVGGGLISKAGQAVKVSLAGTKLGQITGSMVGAVQKFTSGAFLAATKHVSALGSGTVRAIRKCVSDVAKVGISQGKIVGEEIDALIDRLGVTYQTFADRLSVVCKTEADWLRYLPNLEDRLADLSVLLGSELTESGTKGFVEFWTHSLQSTFSPPGDFMRQFLHVCSPNLTLDSQGLARILEMFDSGGNSAFKFTQDAADLSKWISPGGWIYEKGGVEGHRISHVLAHGVPNYISLFDGLPKASHSVFTGLRQDIFKLLDEAWTKPKSYRIKNGVVDQTEWICDMGRVIGTNGETKILIVVDDVGSRSIITAFPLSP